MGAGSCVSTSEEGNGTGNCGAGLGKAILGNNIDR